MRRVVQGLLVLTLVGCSRDNPWFVVNSAGAADSDGPSAGTSTAGGSVASTADVGSSSSGDSGQVDMTTSTSTSSSTTADPGDSTTISTTDPGTSSSSDTGASTDSSTGEPEQGELLYDLHFECKNAAWSDGAQFFPCVEAALEPPSVTPTLAIFENKQFKSITVIPLQKPTAFLDGKYLVTLIGATNPHFRATLWFPPVGNDTDQITGQVYLEVPLTMQVPFISEEFTLKPGGAIEIDLDLTAVQNKAVDLEVHMLLTVDAAAVGSSKGRWLDPRIVHFP